MAKPALLLDKIYKATFHKGKVGGWRSKTALRAALREARRFVLNDDMSGFLADLSVAAFKDGVSIKVGQRLLEQLRTSARLPFRTTWIEYNLHKHQARACEIRGVDQPEDITEVPDVEGWLLQQHPTIETAFLVHIFTSAKDWVDEYGYDVWTFPIAYMWTTDDTPLPWPSALPDTLTKSDGSEIPAATICVGLHYDCDKVGVSNQTAFIDATDADNETLANLMREWMGTLRRMWALLATVNDIPVTTKDVRPSGGFMGEHAYRSFLSHSTITLNVPMKMDKAKLARSIVAIVRRRAHEVRGHWRKNFRKPGERLWIKQHVRGDASLGFVTHDYEVTHDTEE